MLKVNEISGNGNSYTTQFRQYDPRIGRWLSIDPITHEHMSPYNAFDGNPIYYADPSGADSEGSKPTTHEVKKDETVWSIAKSQLGKGAKDSEVANLKNKILKWNSLTSETAKDLKVGQKILTSDPTAGEEEENNSDLPFSFEYTVGKSDSKKSGNSYSNGSKTTNSSSESSNDKSGSSISPIGPVLILSGQRIKILKPYGALGSKPGSSISSFTLRKVFPQRLPGRVMGTLSLGGALGRTVPVIGWILTSGDVYIQIMQFETPEYVFKTENKEWTYGMFRATNKETGKEYYWNPSDTTLKNTIKEFNGEVLDKLVKLKIYTYYYNDDEVKKYNLDTNLQYGFLAQEVEKIFPGLIIYPKGNQDKFINFNELMPLIVKSINEQNSKIEKLEINLKKQQVLIEQIIKKMADGN